MSEPSIRTVSDAGPLTRSRGDRERPLRTSATDEEASAERCEVFVQVLSGPAKGRRAPVVGRLTIGRADDNDLVLADRGVSGHHAVIVVRDCNVIEIRDLGSRNGTAVNGQPVHEDARLEGGEELRFGVTVCRLTRRDRRPLEAPSSETTRYLCAAAYLDPKFAAGVLRIFEERHRAVAPSYGVDVAAVTRHSLAAQRRRQTRDVVLAMILVVGLVLGLAVDDGIFTLGFGAAWFVVFVDQFNLRHSVLARRLTRQHFDPGHVATTMRDDDDVTHLSNLAREEEQGNVTIYSGFLPFIGSGYEIGGWSFAVDIDRPATDAPDTRPEPVDAEELHDWMVEGVLRMGLPGLSVEDRLFVNGKDIRNDRRFLAHPMARPTVIVPREVVQECLRDPTSEARQYLCIRMMAWDGDLVVSIFMRFCIRGKHLFVEASYFLLPSLRDEYRAVDSFSPTPTLRQLRDLARSTLLDTVIGLVVSPFRSVRGLIAPLTKDLAQASTRRAIRENLTFDYGATTSVRQAGTSDKYRRYFQRLDKEMYLKIVERRLLDEIIAFLEEKHIDTSDLKERSNVIYNSGVIVSGGSVSAESLAVGQHARATASRHVSGAVGKGDA